MFELMENASLRAVFLASLLASLASFLPAQPSGIELANLREDVRLLTQRMGDLQLKLEQVEQENRELRMKTANATQNYATIAQLNESVADLNRAIKSAVATSKNETLQQVGSQMEKLAKQTNAAIESLAKNVSSSAPRSPIAAPAFSDDYPKEGITYTVQKGDSLASIAKKTGAASKDIINANKLSDPAKIHAGQALFIPGGK